MICLRMTQLHAIQHLHVFHGYFSLVCRWCLVEGQSHYGSSRRGFYIIIGGLFKRIASILLLRLV